jgi:hypothetical protein
MKKSGRPKGESKINDIKLIQMLRDKKTKQACADFFGVSVSSIKVAEKRIKNSLTPVKVEEDEISNSSIDSIKQLKQINEKIISQLERCDRMFKREEARTEALDEVQKKIAERPNDIDAQEIMDKIWTNNLKSVLAIQTNTINVSGEIRRQIELQLKIAEALFGIQMQQEFQAELINTLKEVDSIVAQKFIAKLKERKILRGLTKMGPV